MTNRAFAAMAAALIFGVPTLTQAAGVSGVYVGATADKVIMVQIVQTPDGRLAGRVENVSLASDGSIKDDSVAMDGAADGRQFTISPKSALVATFTDSATGFIDGDLLDLSWQGGHDTLRRSDAYGFETAVAALHTRAAQIVADRDARNATAAKAAAGMALLQAAQRLEDQVDALDQNSTRVIAELAQADDRYAALSQASQHKRQQQRVFAVLGGMGVQSMSAGTDAQGLMVQMEGIHGQVNGLAANVRADLDSVRRTLSEVALACRIDPVGGGVADPCPGLGAQKSRLDGIIQTLQGSFDKAEASYGQAVAHADDRPHLLRRLLQSQ